MSGYVRGLALAAREAQVAIASSDAQTRRGLIEGMAAHLLAGQQAILAANREDLAKATANGAWSTGPRPGRGSIATNWSGPVRSPTTASTS